jgi:hypothetical protein
MEDRSGRLCSGKLKRRTCTRPRVLQETLVRQLLLALAASETRRRAGSAPASVAV